jgi:hypothetical protein
MKKQLLDALYADKNIIESMIESIKNVQQYPGDSDEYGKDLGRLEQLSASLVRVNKYIQIVIDL